MSTDVVVLKMVSGEEIIARVVARSETDIILDKARILIPQGAGRGQIGVALLPWVLVLSDEEIPVDLNKVMVEVPTTKIATDLINVYLQETSEIQLGGI